MIGLLIIHNCGVCHPFILWVYVFFGCRSDMFSPSAQNELIYLVILSNGLPTFQTTRNTPVKLHVTYRYVWCPGKLELLYNTSQLIIEIAIAVASYSLWLTASSISTVLTAKLWILHVRNEWKRLTHKPQICDKHVS
jgi:hypothetical protein